MYDCESARADAFSEALVSFRELSEALGRSQEVLVVASCDLLGALQAHLAT